MVKVSQLRLTILALASFAIAAIYGAAEEAKIEFTPAAMAAGPSETVLLCGDYYNHESDEQGYWFWKVDGEGKRIWTKMFSAADQDELIALSPLSPGNWVALGQRFVDSGGYTPFIQSIDADGNAGQPIKLDAYGISHTLLRLSDGSWLIAGTSKKDRAHSGEGGGGSDYDAWLLRFDSSGKILWQKWFDNGSDDTIFVVLLAPDAGFICLSNSGKLDKFGSGPSEVRFFKCSADGTIERAASVPSGRFVATGGAGLLVQNADRLTFACSVPQSAGKSKSRDMFTFPALIASYSDLFELKWKAEFLENHSLTTPLLVGRGQQGYLMATAGKKGPVLTELSMSGKVEKTIKGEAWPFEPMMLIEALNTEGTSAYILGVVSDYASDEDDTDHVFLTRFDTSKGTVVWQEKY